MKTEHVISLIGIFVGPLITVWASKLSEKAIYMTFAVIVGAVIGAATPWVAGLLRDSGKLKDEFEYYAFMVLVALFLFFSAALIAQQANMPPKPVIHRYAPDGVHVDYE